MLPMLAVTIVTRYKQVSLDASYIGLPRCKMCFWCLVTERQEGRAVCNEMMKASAHLTCNFSVKQSSNGLSSLLLTDWCPGYGWSLLGEEDDATVQICIAYAGGRCLAGSGGQVLAALEADAPALVQEPTSLALCPGCCWEESVPMVWIPPAPSALPWDVLEREKRKVLFIYF